MAYALRSFATIYMRHWRKKNREKVNADQRARYRRDPDRFKVRNRAYYERNKERLRAQRRERYARQKLRATVPGLDRSPHREEIERFLAAGGKIQRLPDQTPWAVTSLDQLDRLGALFEDESGAA